ncbi:MAG: GNAT family N-acetyltransferase [Muribaculaceae bacterium]|nr:GNAT family N-acetyltransferase [Muribaculaceae bacterium]MDE6321441.1 GNAT family N-acetyltransferase [Muribaculaceae bacterium]
MLSNDFIRLRAIEPTDIDAIFRWENDSRLWSTGSAVAPFSRKQVWDYVSNYTADPYASGELRLMIVDAKSGDPLGMIDITNFDPVNRRGQVGIMVDIAHQRLGVARNALELLAEYARDRLGMHQLWAIIPAENIASRALFEQNGYAIEGHLRSWLRVGREYRDAYFYHRFLQ